MEMPHTGGHQQKLDILQAGEGEGVDGSDGVVIDDQHGDVLRACEGVAWEDFDPWWKRLPWEILEVVSTQYLLYPR